MVTFAGLDQGLRSALGGDSALTVEFYTEYLDLLRFPGPAQQQRLVDYLGVKYRAHRIDLIVVVSPPALEFLLAHGEEIFPGVPIVFTSVNVTTVEKSVLKPNITGIAVIREFKDTLDIALRLQPDTTHVVVPVGTSALEKSWGAQTRAALQPFESRVEMTYLTDLPIADVLARLRGLPPHTIVLFASLFFYDGAGNYMLPEKALELICQASSVPVYGTQDVYLGTGIVGGALYDMTVVGTAAGRIGHRILAGEAVAHIPVEKLNPNHNVFDARQLKRWGISAKRLPPDSVVKYAEPSAWELYKPYILASVALFVVQSLLISTLVMRTRRLKHSESRLQELSGRLISVQDEERKHIARELHDVLGQALTALKMEVAWMGRRLADDTPATHAKVATTVGLIDDMVGTVRRIATDLRPGVLDELGLAAAVEWQAREFEHRTGIHCLLRTTVEDVALDPLVSTAVFRIFQESLTNVTRHSGAARVSVTLECRNRDLVLEVQDDGVGIAATDATSHRSIGLAGMRERAHLVGGGVSISSAAGAGTTVLVQIPWREAAST